MSEEKPFYLTRNSGFGSIGPADELLHPERNRLVADASVTETQYFGFSIPEHRIHALGYMWHHPRLKVVTGGLCVFQGVKNNTMEAELCDLRGFMSDEVLKDDLHEFRLENGYGVKVVEPLKRFRLTYADRARGHDVDLEFEALLPAVMYADGNHFEQAMQVRGKLVMRGKTYEVNGTNVRDRSWGKSRREDVLALPPMSWMTGVFRPDFAFNCTVMDQASRNPEIKGTSFELPEEQTFNCGWVQRDGKTACIVSARKKVTREPGTLLPRSLELEFRDDLGRDFAMTGTLVAGVPYPQSLNVKTMIGLMRWECEGLVAHGDCQEAYWNDYVVHMAARSAG